MRQKLVYDSGHLIEILFLRVDRKSHDLAQLPQLGLAVAPVRILDESPGDLFAHVVGAFDASLFERGEHEVAQRVVPLLGLLLLARFISLDLRKQLVQGVLRR